MKRAITATATLILTAGVVSARATAASGQIVKVAESEHFVFMAASKNGRTLDVDAKRSERELRELSKTLGVSVSGKTTYVRVEYPEEVAFLAGEPSRWSSGVANARTRTIHSIHPHHAHEVVHIVSAQLGEPGTFFSEGLAVALGDQGRMGGRDVDDLARHYLRQVRVERVLASFHAVEAFAAYSIAGSFVRHLIERHDAARVAQFFRASSAADTRTAFRETFGLGLDDALREWQASL